MHTIVAISAILMVAQVSPDLKDRKPHPFAPSLPLLTKEESAKIDTIIDRFIDYDIGKLKGESGKKALKDFNDLGPEAIFNLIDGLNRAANLEGSCPAVIIGRKVAKVLGSTNDMELLVFAKDNIGAGVTAKRHTGVLQDLQFNILLRKGALQRQAAAAAKGGKSLAKMSPTELSKYAERQSVEGLKSMLKHDRSEVRVAAAQAVGSKKLRLGAELIALLEDSDDDVRQAGRRALVRLGDGGDYGPERNASTSERATAVERWREWLSRQK